MRELEQSKRRQERQTGVEERRKRSRGAGEHKQRRTKQGRRWIEETAARALLPIAALILEMQMQASERDQRHCCNNEAGKKVLRLRQRGRERESSSSIGIKQSNYNLCSRKRKARDVFQSRLHPCIPAVLTSCFI